MTNSRVEVITSVQRRRHGRARRRNGLWQRQWSPARLPPRWRVRPGSTAANYFAGVGSFVSIEFVGLHRTARLGIVLNHVERGGVLGGAGGFAQPGINDEIVPVLDHHMAHVTELGLLAEPFAEQPDIRVCGRRMRVVGAFLATEVALGVAPHRLPAMAACRRPSAQNSSCWPTPRSACRQPSRNARCRV